MSPAPTLSSELSFSCSSPYHMLFVGDERVVAAETNFLQKIQRMENQESERNKRRAFLPLVKQLPVATSAQRPNFY